MGKTSNIEWADSTGNEMMGCDGCELWRQGKPHEPGAVMRADGAWWIRICYAGVQTENILRNGPRKGFPVAFNAPTLFPERMATMAAWKDLTGTTRPDKPWLSGMPRVIFLNDMGDTFTASLPLDHLAPHLPLIARSPHLWLVLTKRPDRAAEFSRAHTLPANLWLGTSITSTQDARLRALDRVKASLLFVSYEPILADAHHLVRQHPGIGWWIFGGASGTEAPPTEIGVIRAGVAACREMGAAPFVKQLGAWAVDVSTRHFDTFLTWVNKASGWLNPDDACIDARGRVLRGGADFMRARDEGAFPVAIHRALPLRHPKGGDMAEWEPGLRVREFPKETR